jgi:hypothetical protein
MSRTLVAIAGVAVGVAVALAVALVVVIASGDDDEARSPEGGPATFQGAPPEGFEELRDCLAEHGVEPPAAGEPQLFDLRGARMREALEACGELIPEGFAPGVGPPGLAPGGLGRQ